VYCLSILCKFWLSLVANPHVLPSFFFFSHLEWMKDHGGKMPTGKRLLEVRANPKTEDDWDLLVYYWDVLMHIATNKHWWGPERRHYKILQCTEEIDGNPDSNPVTPGSEALCIFLIENNEDKWPWMFDWVNVKKKGKVPSSRKDYKELNAKYSLPNSGKKAFGGWSDEGHKRYEEIRKEIIKIRKAGQESQYKLERECLRRVREKNRVTFATPEEAERAASRAASVPTVVIMDDEPVDFESSSGEEDSEEENEEEQQQVAAV